MVSLLALAGCTATATDDVESSDSAIEVMDHELWAGLTSYTIARYSADPCNDGRSRLDDDPISYDSWVRQRAGVRNVCFEVWKPGVTDRENPDFWRLLDVQVHYRYAGTSEWKTAYVPAIDRRGNNRRYAWTLSTDLDPMFMGTTVADVKAPFEILTEAERSAQVKAELEFYFTVNGRKLSSSTNQSFRVSYYGSVDKPALHAGPAGGHVLHADVECGGGALRLGSGAGYLAADVKDPAAIAALGAGLDGSMIYASRMSKGGAPGAEILSLSFGSIVSGGEGGLPRYVDGYYASSWRAEATGSGPGTMKVTVKAYDRAAKKVSELSYTFDGCQDI